MFVENFYGLDLLVFVEYYEVSENNTTEFLNLQ